MGRHQDDASRVLEAAGRVEVIRVGFTFETESIWAGDAAGPHPQKVGRDVYGYPEPQLIDIRVACLDVLQ